jgi:hypothetical protein
MPAQANVIPVNATAAVNSFGTRRVRRSIAAATHPAIVTAPTAAGSDACSGPSNVLPQHGVDRVAQAPHRDRTHESDQCDEHRVLEEVLAFLTPDGAPHHRE